MVHICTGPVEILKFERTGLFTSSELSELSELGDSGAKSGGCGVMPSTFVTGEDRTSLQNDPRCGWDMMGLEWKTLEGDLYSYVSI